MCVPSRRDGPRVLWRSTFLIVCSSADSSGTARPWKSAGAAEAVVVAEEVIDR